ncbi:hypothetical protein M0804_001598 [Polistes exclamans]|nr:hypothetical protein M0804_001598 [Polistes exclamans]
MKTSFPIARMDIKTESIRKKLVVEDEEEEDEDEDEEDEEEEEEGSEDEVVGNRPLLRGRLMMVRKISEDKQPDGDKKKRTISTSELPPVMIRARCLITDRLGSEEMKREKDREEEEKRRCC